MLISYEQFILWTINSFLVVTHFYPLNAIPSTAHKFRRQMVLFFIAILFRIVTLLSLFSDVKANKGGFVYHAYFQKFTQNWKKSDWIVFTYSSASRDTHLSFHYQKLKISKILIHSDCSITEFMYFWDSYIYTITLPASLDTFSFVLMGAKRSYMRYSYHDTTDFCAFLTCLYSLVANAGIYLFSWVRSEHTCVIMIATLLNFMYFEIPINGITT